MKIYNLIKHVFFKSFLYFLLMINLKELEFITKC